jgi:hypothetical protein
VHQQIRPDEAMGLLYPADGPPPGAPPAPTPAGYATPAEEPGLTLMAQLAVTLETAGNAAARLADIANRAQLDWEDCHPVPLSPLSNAAAGPLTDERWQPRKGWAWQVLLVTVTFGAGATYAVMYDAAGTEGQIASNARHDFVPSAVSEMAEWEPKGLIVMPGHQMSFASVGGGITVSGQAIEIALDKLPAYLM